MNKENDVYNRSPTPKFLYLSAAVAAKSLQSCLTLCDPMDCSPPGSSFHGDSPAKTLEWVVKPTSRRSSQPRDSTQVSCIAGGLLTV